MVEACLVVKDFDQIGWDELVERDCRQLVRLAIREDLEGHCDWTTMALTSEDRQGAAQVVARQSGIVAGLPAVGVACEELQLGDCWQATLEDGLEVEAGREVGRLQGPARRLLTGERLILNLLSRLSGIATLTRRYTRAVAGTKVRIYDTRKTTPGWRRLEKYAVRCGGGCNHRTGLFDAVLIKDNHLAMKTDLQSSNRPADAVRRVRTFLRKGSPRPSISDMIVEVEVESLSELTGVLAASPDLVLLDNMTPGTLCKAVALRDALAPGVELEASGGVNLETVTGMAQAGVERISVGALTQSAASLDLAVDWLN